MTATALWVLILAASPAPTQAASSPGAAIEWVAIAGGNFLMGSQEGESDERPVRRVRLKAFRIARTEVTRRQYRACVAAGACGVPGCEWPPTPESLDRPAVCVDFEQAQAFSRWVGGRLPTEAEWEYAARSAGRDRRFPWGDAKADCEQAVLDAGGPACGARSPWPVCSKPRGNTLQGLCDMAGNVWEWVQDSYGDSYEGAPVDGAAREPPAGTRPVYRVVRGGSFNGGAFHSRCAARMVLGPGMRYFAQGFRPVRSY